MGISDTTSIKPVRDLPKYTQVTIKNDNRNVAMDSKYIANTRLLTLFDVDNTKGYISSKELEAFGVLQDEYFVELYNSKGEKIRDVEDIDNGNYLVRDFEQKKVFNKETNQYEDRTVRVRAGIFNIETGHEDHSEFIFNAQGEEVGLKHFDGQTQTESIDIEYAEDGVTPLKITSKTSEYNEDGSLKGVKEDVTIIEYDDKGNVTGLKKANEQ